MNSIRLVFKDVLKGLFQATFLYILYSFVFNGIGWFFVSVLFRNEYNFVEWWRNIYVALIIFAIGYYILIVVVRIAAGFWLGNKYKTDFSSALDAIMNYDLHKEDDFINWTPEQFHQRYSTKKTASAMAEVMVESLMRKFG